MGRSALSRTPGRSSVMWFSFPLSPTTTTATTNKHGIKTHFICPGCFPGDGFGRYKGALFPYLPAPAHFEVQKREKPLNGKKVAQRCWLVYKRLHFYISLLFHPMMNSTNLDLFKASVGETTIFVVVTAVHSGAECFSWLRPQS